MTMIGRAAATGEWEIDRLDLEAYLERVDYRGALAADAGTLRGLHRAHAAAIRPDPGGGGLPASGGGEPLTNAFTGDGEAAYTVKSV
jgi:hypothetical protein